MTTLRTLSAVAAAAVLLFSAACTPSNVNPTPPPLPPSTASTPDEDPRRAQEREDKEAAVTAFNEANRIVDEVYVKEGKKEIPADLKQYADPKGSWYQIEAGIMESYTEKGLRFDKPSKVVEVTAGAYSPERIQVFVCLDGRKLNILDEDGKKVRSGSMVGGWLTVNKTDGRWLIGDYRDGKFKKVEKCSLAQ